MKIHFNYDDCSHQIILNKITLFYGGTSCGKTTFSEYLNKAFNGQIKDFMVDNQTVSKNEYDVIYMDGVSNINDEIKLSSKTILNRIIKEIISDIDENVIESIKKNVELQMKPITNRLDDIVANESNFIVDDLMKIIKIYYNFYDESILDTSALSRYEIMKLLGSLNIKKKKRIVIIDDFDLYMDLSQMITLLNDFESIEECSFILFIRSVELCNLIFNDYSIVLMNKGYCLLDKYFDELIKDLIKEQVDYYPLISDDEIKQITYSLKTYYCREILNIISSNNANILIEKMKKNNFYSLDFINVLEKI